MNEAAKHFYTNMINSKNHNIHSLSESEYRLLGSIRHSVSSFIESYEIKISNLEHKVNDLEKDNERLKIENEELKQKLETKNKLFSFWPKIRKI